MIRLIALLAWLAVCTPALAKFGSDALKRPDRLRRQVRRVEREQDVRVQRRGDLLRRLVRLRRAAGVTTVSRYMKQSMKQEGVEAISIPNGLARPDGGGPELPVGLQIIGHRWREDTVLRIGRAAELAMAGPPLRPPR